MITSPHLALGVLLQSGGGKGFGVRLGRPMRPHAPRRPHSLTSKNAAEKIRSHVEPIEVAHRNADGETKIAVRASLINGNFGEPVRILVPEGRAGQRRSLKVLSRSNN